MRHDKDAFAGEAMAAAEAGKLIGDDVRILQFSAYARAIGGPDEEAAPDAGWQTARAVKAILDPFTGCFVSRLPVTVVMLRFALRLAQAFDDGRGPLGVEMAEIGARRLAEALDFTSGDVLRSVVERERAAWNDYYDVLDALERAITAGDPFASTSASKPARSSRGRASTSASPAARDAMARANCGRPREPNGRDGWPSRAARRRPRSVLRRYFRLTWRTTAVECERDPPVAVIVSVKLPTFVAEVVVTVRVDVPFAGRLTGFGLKDALESAGRPVTDRLTLPENPLSGVTVTAKVVVLPRTTTCLAGDALRVKSGGGVRR